jgi:hypothetical protein
MKNKKFIKIKCVLNSMCECQKKHPQITGQPFMEHPVQGLMKPKKYKKMVNKKKKKKKIKK